MSENLSRPPRRAWIVTLAGMSVNLCLGILYAWSVWKGALVATADHPAGTPMEGLNEGWHYLSNAEATWAYVICGFIFALCMIPGGRIQDRFGPSTGATLGGLCLAAGCVVAGLMKSYLGLLLGFGLLGGIGMGLGYAATTPAAVKWFGPHQRGLVVGLVVAGYGAAAIYIAPLADWLKSAYGISGSFIALGALFAIVVVIAGQFLKAPPEGYTPPKPSAKLAAALATRGGSMTSVDWRAGEMLGTWQFYALLLMFFGSAQSGLLVIANATPLLKEAVIGSGKSATEGFWNFLSDNLWLLASFGGLINALGRVGTGKYSDRIGRSNAFWLNAVVAAVSMFLMPWVLASKSAVLLFIAVGIAYWQYGGGLALFPAFTADFFGAKNLGFNYGLVFLGWGLGFLMPQLAGYIKDQTGRQDLPFYISGGLLLAAIAVSLVIRRPEKQAA